MITAFRAENFKGLREFRIELPTPLAILAGANGSGKTSVCEAIVFALHLADERPANVVNEWFGRDDDLLLNLWDRRKRVRFAVEGDFAANGSGPVHRLRWEIEIAKRRGWGVVRERACVLPDDPDHDVLRRKGRAIRVWNQRERRWIDEKKELPSYVSTIAPEQREDYPELWALRQNLKGTFVPFLDPVALRSRSRDPRLEPTGRNFAGFLHSVRTRSSSRYNEIIRRLRTVFADVQSVDTRRDRFGWTDVRVTRRVPGLDVAQSFRAWQVNDGLLRVAALLAIPAAREDLRLFCMEEPENGMHPKLLQQTIDILREFGRHGIQVIVTTHSPVLLNWAKAEEVVVLRNQGSEGPTAHRLEDLPEAMRRLEARHMDIGDILYNLDDDRLFRRPASHGTGHT